MEQSHLTGFQIRVARIFFGLRASHKYAVAGGAGLLASDLINRPTEDLDLFTHRPIESVTAARNAFIDELHRLGWNVAIIVDSPTFCRNLHQSDLPCA